MLIYIDGMLLLRRTGFGISSRGTLSGGPDVVNVTYVGNSQGLSLPK